jgi:hypothetical protein
MSRRSLKNQTRFLWSLPSYASMYALTWRPGGPTCQDYVSLQKGPSDVTRNVGSTPPQNHSSTSAISTTLCSSITREKERVGAGEGEEGGGYHRPGLVIDCGGCPRPRRPLLQRRPCSRVGSRKELQRRNMVTAIDSSLFASNSTAFHCFRVCI